MSVSVFLSYSRVDAFIMDRIKDLLETSVENGEEIKVWTDRREIQFGDLWKRRIHEGLKNIDYMLVLVSPEAAASRWVKAEIDIAKKYDVTIVPILIRGTSHNIPYSMSNLNYVNATRGNSDDLEKLVHDLKTLGTNSQQVLRQITASPQQVERSRYIALSATKLLLIKRFLDAAASYLAELNVDKYKGMARATLLWVDPKTSELYIAAATDHYEERELLWRFKDSVGFAGLHMKNPDFNQIFIDRPSEFTAEQLQEKFASFDEEELHYTHQIDLIISVPISNDLGEFTGILSIDYKTSLDDEDKRYPLPSDRSIKGKRQKWLDIVQIIRQLPIESPMPYYRMRRLDNIVDSARMVAPVPVPLRSAIFLVDENKKELYMVSGSEAFMTEWSISEVRFKREEGLIGFVWETGEMMTDEREGMSEAAIQLEWQMNEKQFVKAKNTLSIVGVPIYRDRQFFGVLVVDSPLPMRESRLDFSRVFLQSLAEVAAKALSADDDDYRIGFFNYSQ